MKTNKEVIKEFDKIWFYKDHPNMRKNFLIEDELKSFLLQTRKNDREEFIKILEKLKGEKKKLPERGELSLRELSIEQIDYRGKCIGYNKKVQKQNKKIDNEIKNL